MVRMLELMSVSHGVLNIEEREYARAITFLRNSLCTELQESTSGHSNTRSYIMQYISALYAEAEEQREYYSLQDMRMSQAEHEDVALQEAQRCIGDFIKSVAYIRYMTYSHCTTFWKAYYKLEQGINDICYNVSHTIFALKRCVTDVWERRLGHTFELRTNEFIRDFSCLAMGVSAFSMEKLYSQRDGFTHSLSLLESTKLATYNDYTKGYLFDSSALPESLMCFSADGYISTLGTGRDSFTLEDILRILCDNLCSRTYLENNTVYMVKNNAGTCKRYYNMPIYSRFAESCTQDCCNEILIRKPVEPAGLFYMGSINDVVIPDDVRANSFVMGVPAFCIDKEGAGIRRVS